jgi:speckle-type POZ protein
VLDPTIPSRCWGIGKFIKKMHVVYPKYLTLDDRLTIVCNLSVVVGDRVSGPETTASENEIIDVPPSNLPENLGNLLGTKEGADVTFKVKGVVFKALLHFIYTDSLPAANDDDCDLDYEGVVEHLLVAADRYAMDRMRLMCESMLCKRLDAENVAATLALADQHYCSKLKDACISFMSSRKRIKDVMGTQGYEHLKKAALLLLRIYWRNLLKSSVCRVRSPLAN